jgi:hypothetical protein
LDPSEDEAARGKLDAVAVLYIVGGIPAILAFIILVFGAVKACNIPA